MLDTRDSLPDFHQAHVERSISAPLHSAFFSNSAGSYLGPEEPFVVILERAEDLELATRQLYRIGIDGAQAWILFSDVQQSGLCTRKTEIQQMGSFAPALIGAEGAILDVRTTAEFNAKHLPGALSIPYTRLRARVNEIPVKKKLYVHCASGKRAALATSFLAAQGHDVVYLDGEFAACVKNNSI